MKKIVLIISLIGVFILLFLSQSLEPKHLTVQEIKKLPLESKVKLSGIIFSISGNEIKNIYVQDKTGEIKATCKCNLKNLSENKNITIIGNLGIYQTEKQIYIKKIIKN